MNKSEKYQLLIKQAISLIDSAVDDIANMANLTRLLMDHFPNHWIGFYRVVRKRLVLGPYQGPIACTTISYGKGVCGTAWEFKQTQIVGNVDEFPGHIACSSESKSEIVIPCMRNGEVYAVLDIDSDTLNTFDSTDAKYLEELVSFL